MSETSSPEQGVSRETRIWIAAGTFAAVLLIAALALVLWQPGQSDQAEAPTPTLALSTRPTTEAEALGLSPFTYDPEPLPAGAALPQFTIVADSPSSVELPRQANVDTNIPTRPRFEIEKYTIQDV